MCDNEIFIKRLKCVLVQFHEIFGQFLAILRKKSEKSRFRSVDTKSTLGRVAKKRPRPADFDRPQTLWVKFLNFHTVQEWKIVSTPLAVSLLTIGAIYTFAMEVREPRLWTLNPAQFCFLCILSTWKSCRFDTKKMVPVISSIFLKKFFLLKGYHYMLNLKLPFAHSC